MKVYFLYIKRYAGYDSYDGHVVIANSEEEARKLCPDADEGPVWTNPDKSSCDEIGIAHTTTAEVVLSSFNAG